MATKPRKAARKAAGPSRKAQAKPVRKPVAKGARKASARASPTKAKPAAPARKSAKRAASPAPPPAPPVEPAPAPAATPATPAPKAPKAPTAPARPLAWEVVEPESWIPVPDPAPARGPPTATRRPFDPATGTWLPARAPPAAPPAVVGRPAPAVAAATPEPAPEAAKKTTGATVWTVILGIDLGFLALNFLAQLAVGAILLFAPESSAAQDLQEQFGVASPRALAAQQVLTFVLMGVVPFLWVLGTRRVTWEGTKRYLHLQRPVQGILRGIALTPLLVLAVVALVTVYTVATQGTDALSLTESEEGQNPAVDAILEQLTWPVAILIALTAGVGEEILFRGVLQRWVGLWGQAVLFGLAHAAGGFLPQILFAAGLGVLFGHLIRRGWSLWTLMTAHFLYDLVLLGTSLVYG